MNVEELLKTIGKEQFVTYFYEFRHFSKTDMERFLVLNNVSNEGGAEMRVRKARELFENNFEEAALENVIQSRVPNIVREKAQMILNSL